MTGARRSTACISLAAILLSATRLEAASDDKAGADTQTASSSASTSASGSASTSQLTAKEQAKKSGDDPTVSLFDQPHTVAMLEAGVIVLPNAAISDESRGGNTPVGTIGKGDATIQTGIHLLYRANADFIIGATAFFAPRPTSSKIPQSEGSNLERFHSRSYLFLGIEGRYIPLRYRYFEISVGLIAGGIIIADRYTTEAGDRVPTIFGSREVTVRTEGFALGLQVGADYLITDNWVAGLGLRADRWILPNPSDRQNDPACTPIRDCPTLSGTTEAFIIGLTIGYRIPL